MKFIKVHSPDHDLYLVNMSLIESIQTKPNGNTVLYLQGYKKCPGYVCVETVDEIYALINAAQRAL